MAKSVSGSMVVFKTSNLWSQIRLVPQLIVRSVVGSNDWSYDRSHDATSARTIGHRMPRLLALRSIAGCNDRLIVPSVVGRHDWSYIGRWSLPLVARFPTMARAIVRRDRYRPNRNQSYAPEIVRSSVTVALIAHVHHRGTATRKGDINYLQR